MKRLLNLRNGILQGLLILGFGLNLGCSKGGSSNNSNAAGSATESSAQTSTTTASTTDASARQNPHTCTQTSGACYSETFQEGTSTQPVDILFVLQTSSSIDDVKPSIVAGINSFIQTLPANSDFNIAVMLSHGSTSSLSGVLYQAGTEPVVLKSTQLSNTQIQTYLDTKLNQVVQDPDSGGGEEGMFSLFHGITTASLLSASQTAGFFRPNAALGIVFIADRRDICAVVPAGVPAETDPTKLAARARDCEGLTAAGLTFQLDQLKGSEPLIASGIIYARPPVPTGKEIGYGYTDVINLNHGVAIDIAQDNIANGLSSIEQLAGTSTGIQNQFTLSHSGIDPNKIIVTVNGQGVPFTLSNDVVTITQTIPANATVIIAYCLKSTPSSGDGDNDGDDDHDHDHHHHFTDWDGGWGHDHDGGDDGDDNDNHHHDDDDGSGNGCAHSS